MNTKPKDQQLAQEIARRVNQMCCCDAPPCTAKLKDAILKILSDAQVNDAFRALEYQQSFPVQK